MILYADLALGDVFDNCVCQLVANLHWQVMTKIKEADLTNILGLRYLLTDDRGFISGVTARAPSKLGIWPLADMTLCSILYLHTMIY